MANTLTNLIPTIYEALDVVSREMVGFIPAVTPNTSAERAALNQSILVPLRWNGEQQVGMRNAGTYDQVLNQQFQQAFRTLVNLVEADLFTVGYQGASRAYGTAGNTPFATATDLSDAAQVRKILDDNG